MRAFYRRRGKRLLDLALTIPALICLAPLMGLVALLVRARLGAPVLFRQVRPGLHGQPFTMFKFRTMTGARDAEGNLLPDSERLTPLGRALRSASLDELPELWNVLRGEMSLVGPRPLRVEYLPLYTAEQARRHELCPGLTGWAQIRGRTCPGRTGSPSMFGTSTTAVCAWTFASVERPSSALSAGRTYPPRATPRCLVSPVANEIPMGIRYDHQSRDTRFGWGWQTDLADCQRHEHEGANLEHPRFPGRFQCRHGYDGSRLPGVGIFRVAA